MLGVPCIASLSVLDGRRDTAPIDVFDADAPCIRPQICVLTSRDRCHWDLVATTWGDGSVPVR